LLELDGTEISDVGLIHLKNAKRLRHLYLSRTRITDAGLAHLHGLPDLRSVALDDTATTPDGVAALKAATPTIQAFDRHGAGQLIQMERDGVPVSFFKPGPRRRAVPLRGQRSTVQNTSDADD
jgi:hypothetical protein